MKMTKEEGNKLIELLNNVDHIFFYFREEVHKAGIIESPYDIRFLGVSYGSLLIDYDDHKGTEIKNINIPLKALWLSEPKKRAFSVIKKLIKIKKSKIK